MKRQLILGALAVLLLAQPAAILLADAGGRGLLATASIQNQPSNPGLDVDLNITEEKTTTEWYLNPVWLAIGGLALLLLIALVVMAARGGGSTVIAK